MSLRHHKNSPALLAMKYIVKIRIDEEIHKRGPYTSREDADNCAEITRETLGNNELDGVVEVEEVED
jgi:hypothetical protein